MSKIVVLTPVKNEDWILEQFLSATSMFADCIIIADQFSSDNSRAIAKKFSKVKLIDNKNSEFNEAERQIMLIEAARSLFAGEKIIFFCLDADEIITADSLIKKQIWDDIRNKKEGTAFYFEKPEMLPGLERCSRWRNNYAPLAFVDDGAVHKPKEIHSFRIPTDLTKDHKEVVDDIKFMHFAHTRVNVQSAKYRFYSVIENTKNITPVYLRRYNYQSFFDLEKKTILKNVEITPKEWTKGYEASNIYLKNLPDPQYSWHDFEVLKLFKKFGFKKFRWDNIWEFDWERCRLNALKLGKENIPDKIVYPSKIIKIAGKIIDVLYNFYRLIKKKI